MATPILAGVVGSHAYNLATPASDVDRMQVVIDPLSTTLGLDGHQRSRNTTSDDSDVVVHEVGKFCHLALAANPNILECLFLPEYEFMSFEGALILAQADKFLSQRIRTTFCGYARSQFTKLTKREGDSFSSDTRNRTTKHARHMFRLLKQGEEALRTGSLRVRLTDDEAAEIHELAQLNPQQMVDEFEQRFAATKDVVSPLPQEPDRATVNRTLIHARLHHGRTVIDRFAARQLASATNKELS